MGTFDLTLARKGRGALSNAVGRFEPEQRVAFDDGWGGADEAPTPLQTLLTIDSTKTIIARQQLAGCRLRPLDQPLSRL